jgi:hypothetical protein
VDETGSVSIDAGDWRFHRRDPVSQAQQSLYDPELWTTLEERYYEIESADGRYAGHIVFSWFDEHPEKVTVGSMGLDDATNPGIRYNAAFNNIMGPRGLARVLSEVIQAENPWIESVDWLGTNSASFLNKGLNKAVDRNLPNRFLHQTNLFPGENYSIYGSQEMAERASQMADANMHESGLTGLQTLLAMQRRNLASQLQTRLF